MGEEKLSEFVYVVDLDNQQENYGVYGIAGFSDRTRVMDYCEELARSNPEISVTVQVRSRLTYRKA